MLAVGPLAPVPALPDAARCDQPCRPPSCAPRLVGRRRHLPRAAGGGRLPRGAGRAHRPAARRVRLVAVDDLLRRGAQHGVVRAHRTVRRGADGAVRDPPGGGVRAAGGRGGQRADGVHDGQLAADRVLGRARRAGHRVDGDVAGRHGHRPLVRRPPRAGVRGAHRGWGGRPAGVPAGGRAAERGLRLAARSAGHLGRRARRRPAGGVAAARSTTRHRRGALRRHRGRRRRPGARQRRARGTARAGRRRPHPAVLAAGRWLPDLRGEHQRAGAAALHPGRARPRHAGDHGGRAAGAGRAVRHRRHHRVGLADRPGRPPAAAAHLLRAARGVPGAAAAAVRHRHRSEHGGVHRVLRPGLGGHRAADAGAVPGALRRPGAGGVRLGVRQPPGRGGAGGLRRWRGAGHDRLLRRRLVRRGGAVPGRGRAVGHGPPRRAGRPGAGRRPRRPGRRGRRGRHPRLTAPPVPPLAPPRQCPGWARA